MAHVSYMKGVIRMTEEKRIIVSENGALCGNSSFQFFTNNELKHSHMTPTPMTRYEFIRAVATAMIPGMGDAIEFIGTEKFWNTYNKPISSWKGSKIKIDRYYVQVKSDFFAEDFTTYYVKHDDGSIHTMLNPDLHTGKASKSDKLKAEFTLEEIHKYHLEDCKRELVK